MSTSCSGTPCLLALSSMAWATTWAFQWPSAPRQPATLIEVCGPKWPTSAAERMGCSGPCSGGWLLLAANQEVCRHRGKANALFSARSIGTRIHFRAGGLRKLRIKFHKMHAALLHSPQDLFVKATKLADLGTALHESARTAADRQGKAGELGSFTFRRPRRSSSA